MNDFMIAQNNPQSKCRDFEFSGGITIAVYTEGMNQAYHVARLADSERMKCYHAFIREASEYIQITDYTDWWHKGTGGFWGA